MGDQNNGGSLLGKVLGGLFAALVAPIMTGVVVLYIQKKFDEPKENTAAPPAAPAVPAPAPAPGTAPPIVARSEAKTSALPSRESEKAPAAPPATASSSPPDPKPAAPKDVPKESAKVALASPSPSTSNSSTSSPVPPPATSVAKKKKGQLRGRLFNGKDLTGFETYLGVPYGGASKAALGLSKDPDHVFSVQDGDLHISGKVFGGLLSTREYENYHLVVDYKWGDKKWPPRNDLPRLSGIVLHATGEPGTIHGWSMAGITCMIGETGTGALSLPEGLPRSITLYAEAERLVFKKGTNVLVYKPGEPLAALHTGTLHAIGWRPPLIAAKAVPGKLPKDPAHPVGEWNRLECICEGDRIAVIVNGTTVNVATRVSQTKGKLFIQSFGAEIWFRTINVRPLTAAAPVAGPTRPARP
jgi:hypothetical protein